MGTVAYGLIRLKVLMPESGQTDTNHHVSRTSALYPEAGLPNIALANKQPSIRRPHCVGLFQ
jgi:hypothetical protein